MNTAIETNHLGKNYRRVTAVDDLSLRVARGEIYAFLGLNGAGKTTTIRMLLVTPIAFFACAGHGYLPPVGILILLVVLAQVSVIIGRGEYFPWAIPALYAQGEPLGLASVALVILTSIAGVMSTAGWWERADQTH